MSKRQIEISCGWQIAIVSAVLQSSIIVILSLYVDVEKMVVYFSMTVGSMGLILLMAPLLEVYKVKEYDKEV